MRDEIRERIETVRRGDVPEGYRRSRAGLMPLDWPEGITAKDVFRNYTDKSHGGEYEVLSATQDRGIIPRRDVDIDIKFDDGNLETYKKVDSGDFVISLRSFQGGIEYSEYEGIVSPAYTVLKANRQIEDGYYKAYFKTDDFIQRLNGAVYGIRDGKQIGFEDFGDLILHYPPIPEQRRIAEILDTCDRVIKLKRELIEGKRKQKQILMTRLLDPAEGSLDNEHVLWTEVTIGSECLTFSGGTPSAGKEEFYKCGTIPFIRSAEIGARTTELYLTELGFDNSAAKMVEPGDILYALYGANSGDCAITKIHGAINQAILCIRPKTVDKNLLYYALCYKKDSIVSTYLQGGQGNLSAEIIKSITLKLPQNPDYIKGTICILQLVDRELEGLEEELMLWQQKKKALMQLLLTGLVRVNA